MAFVNLSLLAGGVLVAIPILLHLMMRQRPKQLVFPALRFVQQRRIANERRLQLRHWLLLALRCAVLGLFALALARPTVASAALSGWVAAGLLWGACLMVAGLAVVSLSRGLSRLATGGLAGVAVLLLVASLFAAGRAIYGKSPVLGDQQAPVAAAIVLDTAPRMQYRQHNKTRLAAAQEIAHWLVSQFPADSEVAILDSRAGGGFAVDRAAAEKSLERLRPVGTPRPLVESLSNAIELLKPKPQQRKEVYVLTDLTAAAWKSQFEDDLKKLLTQQPGILLYVIDVGAEQSKNFALADLSLSGEVLAAGGDLTIEAVVTASGVGGTRSVELLVDELDPTLPTIREGKVVLPKTTLRGSQTAQLEPGGSARVRFTVRGLAAGVHQGLVRLVGEDGLALDDMRHFAVEVQEAWPLAVVSPADVSPWYLTEIEKSEVRARGSSRFRMELLDQPRLATQELTDFRAVVLLDPGPLTPDEWTKLGKYCEAGGGLAAFLGHHAEPPLSFQDAAAVAVLGGKLTRQTRTGGEVFLAPRSFSHPILAGFREQQTSIPWDRFPVFFHWNLDDLGAAARTVLPFSNGRPAVIENRVGRGRVLVMTTPISEPPEPVGRQSWNELTSGEDAWPCFMLVNEMLDYLVKSGQARLNVLAGETVVLPNDPAIYPERYQLFTPLEQPQDVLATGGQVTVRFTDNPGAYRLRGQKGGPVIRGFAVNLAADASDLSRLPRERLEELLGQGRYQLAKSREEIDRAVGNDRLGSEFYPLLVTLLAVALGLEHVLANRFYRHEK